MALSKNELDKLGLGRKVEILWKEGSHKTKNGRTPDIEQASGLNMVIAHYEIIAERQGYDPLLRETGYKVKGHRFKEIKLATPVNLKEITYYCTGPEITREDWPKHTTKYVPIAFFRRR